MLLAPRLAHFVGPPTPYRGQHQRPGKAGSAVFLEKTATRTNTLKDL
jgi:hypothetical protein